MNLYGTSKTDISEKMDTLTLIATNEEEEIFLAELHHKFKTLQTFTIATNFYKEEKDSGKNNPCKEV